MPVSLVTGGAGFMGSHIADELIEKGHHVIVLDDLSGGFSDNVPKGVTFVQGSILDFELLDRIFKKYSFTYVYHLAAYAAEGLSHFIKRFNYNNNLIGSVNIINACVNYQVKCLVFTSSIAVYGAGDPPLRDDVGIGAHGDHEREVTADRIQAGHHHARVAVVIDTTAFQHETPHRHDEVGLEPGIAEPFARGQHPALQPMVPGFDERLGQATADEIAMRADLAVKADFCGPGHRRSGQRK